MSCDSRRSLITHPDAILFSRISREGVFQQTRLISSVAWIDFVSPTSQSLLATLTIPVNLMIYLGLYLCFDARLVHYNLCSRWRLCLLHSRCWQVAKDC